MSQPALALILQVAVDPTLLAVMQWAVIVAGVAIVVQTVLLFAMFLASRSIKQQVTALTEKVEPVADSARQTLAATREVLDEVRGYAREYVTKGNDILDMTRQQLPRRRVHG